MQFPRLIGDIGGTNARWAWQAEPDAPLMHIASDECADFPTLEAAVEHYLGTLGGARPQAMAIGVATAVTGDHVAFTNNAWSFSTQALRARLGVSRLLVLNDFAALALSLPRLGRDGLRPLGPAPAQAAATREPIVIVGPGTGLGVAALAWQRDGQPLVISGEGGHATVAATDERQAQVLERLRRRFEHVSAERVLSGPGLVNLYRALCELDGHAAQPLEAADVTQRAGLGSDAVCIEAVQLFVAFLGSFAGNMALTYGARGGAYIGGGIAPRLGALLDPATFRAQFEAKGRLGAYLKDIPSWLVTESFPGLIGAAHALDL
ncbi:MAG: glucokinase [Pelomonas sp.]|nr:glucokinase [Roseateles sp.]